MEGFFDEKSNKWIGYFKKITIVLCCLYIVAAIVVCITNWLCYWWITDLPFLEALVYLGVGVMLSAVQLVVNMLIIQFLSNVQIIREQLENKE